jgi:acyl carrier protein
VKVNREEIAAKLTPIFHDVMETDSIVLNENLTAEDVEQWDSFSHMRLIIAVEKAFETRFSTAEIGRLDNVGSLITLLGDKS